MSFIKIGNEHSNLVTFSGIEIVVIFVFENELLPISINDVGNEIFVV